MRERWRLLPLFLAFLGIVGLGISTYLTAAHFGDKPIACGGVGECDYVNASPYASIGGVPVSLLGAGLYLALIVSALLWSHAPFDERRMVAYWGLSLSGAGYAAYLTYVELWVIDAICLWCVASAVVLLLSLSLATAALLLLPSSPPYPAKGR